MVCASLLAGSLGADFKLIEEPPAVEARSAYARGFSSLFIVGLPALFTDAVLFELLEQVTAGLSSDIPWGEIPRFSLITGRDLPSLSWLVAKILISARAPKEMPDRSRLAYYEFPGSGVPSARELCFERENGRSGFRPVETVLQGAQDILATYTQPSEVIVVATHGFEACAEGGAGVVLCGLHSSRSFAGEKSSGILACGRGYPCPRGPHPLPVRLLRTPVFMLASCNSFRLAGSQLKSDFNLAYSFLDGQGRNYVSSPSTITHAQPCSVAFAAAMASGRSVSQATTLVNGLLYCAGIDQPTFVGIGMGNYRAGSSPDANIRMEAPGHHVSLPGEIDLGEANYAEIVISTPQIVELARRRLLALDLGNRAPGERVFYFYRLERAHSSGNGETAEHMVRVFLFSFPTALGRMRVSQTDLVGLRETAAKTLQAASFWLDFVRLAELGEKVVPLPQIVAEVGKSRAVIANSLSSILFDGSAAGQLQQQVRVLASLTMMTRDLALDHLMLTRSGSFFLTNLWGDEYRVEGNGESTCHNCGGRAFRKTLRHVLHGAGRLVINCWRCGFISDVPESDAVRGVYLDAPDVIPKGKRFKVRVTIDAGDTPKQSEFRVWARINAQEHGHLVPEPDCTYMVWSGGRKEVSFEFDSSGDVPPHGYAIRALVASAEEVASAGRGIFIGERAGGRLSASVARTS